VVAGALARQGTSAPTPDAVGIRPVDVGSFRGRLERYRPAARSDTLQRCDGRRGRRHPALAGKYHHVVKKEGSATVPFALG
jgi:hypothetical protein